MSVAPSQYYIILTTSNWQFASITKIDGLRAREVNYPDPPGYCSYARDYGGISKRCF